MRWAAAVKLWNSDFKNVSTANVYAVPRKDTREHAQVKEISALGHLPEKKKTIVPAKSERKPKEKMVEVRRTIQMPGKTTTIVDRVPVSKLEEVKKKAKENKEVLSIYDPF